MKFFTVARIFVLLLTFLEPITSVGLRVFWYHRRRSGRRGVCERHKDLKLLSQHLLSGSGPRRFDLSLGGQPKHTGHINQHGERAWRG